MKCAIVVPTIREQHILEFLSAWSQEFQEHQIIIVEDNPEKTFRISQFNIEHYSWLEINKELGP
ncbi:MAG: hypothetical protein O7E52_15750, partial [Candidatus Poribacteria bacterium]|nr:hypothetical protein [Candidatus Poribacteria bacterium]